MKKKDILDFIKDKSDDDEIEGIIKKEENTPPSPPSQPKITADTKIEMTAAEMFRLFEQMSKSKKEDKDADNVKTIHF